MRLTFGHFWLLVKYPNAYLMDCKLYKHSLSQMINSNNFVDPLIFLTALSGQCVISPSFSTNIHGPQRMNRNDLTHHEVEMFINKNVMDFHNLTIIHCPQRMNCKFVDPLIYILRHHLVRIVICPIIKFLAQYLRN